ncbi:MAG TPA: Gmad2 immunoglobulin-like domain-containing protein [Gaiellaceae bacterium]|nr:Gmad2 immunoglobulin-like domain-containing protein [Gaiellaceae bacterium]
MKMLVALFGLLVAGAAGFALVGCGSDQAVSPSKPQSTATATAPGQTGTQLPAIVVDKPVIDDRVTSPVTVSGTANVFEANVTVEVIDAKGKVVGKTFTTASCGTGCRGTFSVDVTYKVTKEQPGTIVVHDDDAAGTGAPPHSVRIPVTLAP